VNISDLTEPEQELRAAGLRCTAQRLAVLAALRAERRHLSVDELTLLVRARLGAISPQAVYDAAAALERAGLARRVEPAGSPALYEAHTDDHHHLVCRSCGAIVDVAALERPVPAPADPRGFTLDRTEIWFWGTCPACQQLSTTPTTTKITKEHTS
jgi:Fur family ferric uptake transcriptional regulator